MSEKVEELKVKQQSTLLKPRTDSDVSPYRISVPQDGILEEDESKIN